MSAPPLYVFGNIWPSIAPDAFIAPTAAVIGQVTVGPQSGIWFACVLRGDTARITVGARTNIQDGTIVHVNPDMPTSIGDDVTVGHAAIIHACTLHDRAFVGMGATVLDGAVIESGGMLAAGSLLTPNKRIGAGELWSGSPARLTRVLGPEEAARFARTAPGYVALAARYRTGS
jgi:carbonic anhydrase/acetyltransferase-like protein (isoleucine patch superfamily)